MARKFEFNKLKDLVPGCGYGRYWSRNLKETGRGYFILAVQELPEDLPLDPWGFGNSDINDV